MESIIIKLDWSEHRENDAPKMRLMQILLKRAILTVYIRFIFPITSLKLLYMTPTITEMKLIFFTVIHQLETPNSTM